MASPPAAPDMPDFFNKMMKKFEKLSASISSQLIDNIACGKDTDCYKTKHTAALQQNYKDAANDLQNAPIELSLAEKNLYTYNGGTDDNGQSYNNLLIDRYAETADLLRTNSIKKQQEFMANLSQMLKQYQSEILYSARTEQLLTQRQIENAALIKQLDRYNKLVQTNERKVVYEIKDTDGAYTFRRVLLFLYYGAIIFYVIFGNFIPDKLYTNYSIWAIIVIASIFPIILDTIMKWIFIIIGEISYWFRDMPHKDVQWDL